MAAVAEHRAGIGDRLDLRHAVRDVEDREPLVAQLAQDAEHGVHVARGQRGGRLVQDQDLGVPRQRGRELDQLAARERQVARVFLRIDVLAADTGKQGLGAPALAAPVDEAPLSGGLRDEDVVRDREVGNERELLKDADDTLPHGLRRRGEADLLAGEPHGAGVGPDDAGRDLDERALARAVLAQHRVDGMAAAREVDVLQRVHAAIVLGDPVHFEERRIGAASIRHGEIPKGGFARAWRANRATPLYSSSAGFSQTLPRR